ncbi:DUF6703 family protein [Litorivivens sp.]|uniref:DUF6703 family protein n=2 Tax=Litorivivens sp. TaxID=2020868 RepID=UPI0035638B96
MITVSTRHRFRWQSLPPVTAISMIVTGLMALTKVAATCLKLVLASTPIATSWMAILVWPRATGSMPFTLHVERQKIERKRSLGR